jgi:hypothetical protein
MEGVSPSSHGGMRSLISPEHHYIEHETLGSELYDWRQDPKETHDLADSQDGQAVIGWFKGLLREALARRP